MGLNISIRIDGLPDPDLAMADRVVVHQRMGQATQFSIHYSVDISNGDIRKLQESRIGPGSTISIFVPNESELMKCLAKGPVFSQRINLQHGGAGSEMEVQGADSTIIMEREFKSRVWSNVTDSEAVISIVSGYQLIPDIASTNARHIETNNNLVQRSNDLQFVRRLARRNGFHFWLSCNELGVETAHFKRPPLDRQTVADLVINHPDNNMQQMEISWDVERPTQVVGTQLDTTNKQILDSNLNGAPQTSLGNKALMDIAGRDVRSIHVTAPSDDGGDMRARGEGALLESDWFISARCNTSYNQLKKIVQTYDLVNVIGAGNRHSGKYLVSEVRHIIDAVSHQMQIGLIRNGWE